MKGRVKWWSKDKGYGFIEYNDTDNIFAYLKKDDKDRDKIHDNQEIEFYIEEIENCSYIHILNLCEN